MYSLANLDSMIIQNTKALPFGRVILGIIITFVVLNSSEISIKPPQNVSVILNNYLVKAAFVGITLSFFTEKPSLSIIITGLIFAYIQSSNMETYISGESFPDVDDELVLSDIDLNPQVQPPVSTVNEIFQTKREFAVDENNQDTIVASMLSSYGTTVS